MVHHPKLSSNVWIFGELDYAFAFNAFIDDATSQDESRYTFGLRCGVTSV
jgi:hypothetical protein